MDTLIPEDIRKVLTSSLFGFPIWQILLFFLIVPYPQFIIVALIVFPGIKDKLSTNIRNGISGLSGSFGGGSGTRDSVPAQGSPQGAPDAQGSDGREGKGAVREQQLQEAPSGVQGAPDFPESFGRANHFPF